MATATSATGDAGLDVVDTSAEDYWSRFQLAFALYSAQDRAIPSAYDGLKPVQRRVLYQLFLEKLLPGEKPRKSAAVCGRCTATTHPHGDVSVYGAAALMAARFQRVRLIDGQGAFPRVQGDIPASPRYTEMRLSPEGYELLRELNDHAVDMVPTFDGETTEPRILPSRFPALLVNGAVGIAEGWATKTPAHNPREVLALCRALLADPNLDTDAVMTYLSGPDWGGGGIVVSTAGIREYIETGRGSMTVRGRAEIDGKSIIITELPPGLASGVLQDKIRDGVLSGELAGVSDLSDLTDRRNGLRIVVSLKRGADPAAVLAELYRLTPLEDTFAASLVALDADRVPRWWSVSELVKAFLSLRDSVVVRRSEYRLDKAQTRQHLVAGLLAVHIDIDAAVALIRASETVDEARTALCERFAIDDVQADYVLALQLRRLTKLDVIELNTEAETLAKTIEELTELVNSSDARRIVIDAELVETGKLFAGSEYDRCTVIDTDAVPIGGAAGSSGPREKTVNPNWRLDDRGVFSDTHGTLLTGGLGWAVWEDGRVKLTDGSGLPSRIRDTPVAPNITGLLTSGVLQPGEHLVLVSRTGKMLRLDPAGINPQGAAGNGVAGIKLAAGDAVIAAFPVTDASMILSVSPKAWKVLDAADVPTKGRGTSGVGFHPFIAGEDALIRVEVSTNGWLNNGKPVKPALRAKASTKGQPTGLTAADPR